MRNEASERKFEGLPEYIEARLALLSDYRRLAKEVGLSYSQFFRRFKKAFGSSPQKYVESRRIARAKKLLALPSLTIKEIAFESGFKTPLYFSRRFTALTGKSPTRFREELRFDPERILHPYSYFLGSYVTGKTYGSFA